MDKLTITKPSDMHLHLRDKEFMSNVVDFSAKQMSYAVIMPNLDPPITTTADVLSYKSRILAATNYSFKPLMTLYLTDNIKISELQKAKNHIIGCKLYPKGSTTNADNGVRDLKNIYPLMAKMEELDIPLLIHGEVVDKEIDIFDREKIFIERKLRKIVNDFPELRIVFEHITTKEAVDFVLNSNNKLAATITPQHLINNRDDLLAGGIKPHYYCLPILKSEQHRKALINVAISGNPKFFLGTDSAPHFTHEKESACGCAGCFSAPFALEFYTEIFDTYNALDKLEDFAALFGPKFYKIPIIDKKITLIKTKKYTINRKYTIKDKTITPYGFNTQLSWKICN